MSLASRTQTLILGTAIVASFLMTLSAARWLTGSKASPPLSPVTVATDQNDAPTSKARSEIVSVDSSQDVTADPLRPTATGNNSVLATTRQPSPFDLVSAHPDSGDHAEPNSNQDNSSLNDSLTRAKAERSENRSQASDDQAVAFVFQPVPTFPKPQLQPQIQKTAPRTEVVDFELPSAQAIGLSGLVTKSDETVSSIGAAQDQDDNQFDMSAPAQTGNIVTGPLNQSLDTNNDFPVELASGNLDEQLQDIPTRINSNLRQASKASFQPVVNRSSFSPAPNKTPSPVSSPNVARAPNDDSNLPHVLHGSKNYKLAEQPKSGEHFREDRPITDQRAFSIEPLKDDFSPDPNYDSLPYFSEQQAQVYAGKKLYANQRPLVELGRPWYQLGPLSPGFDWLGKHNNIAPQFLVYGDFRSTIASNSANGDNRSLIASELNLDIDLKLTGTERFHAFVSPLDNGLQNTRYLLDEDDYVSEFDANIDFGYFEGDLGAIAGGFIDETLPFDMPFAIGVMPLLLQNGVWMEDAFLGFATTIPARNSARWNISNMDITFFAGYDKITSDAFLGNDSATRMYGIATFIDALNGYFEIDYAYFDDRRFEDQSYHNIGFGYTRRYGRFISNSTRVIVNAGQSTASGPNTADGVLLLSENSLISGAPSTLVPYFNLFAGFDRPQSAARAVQAGGVLRNTGILFETDGMTNYPTLDATANDTYGGAFGINLIADDFSQQLVLEMAMLGVMGEDTTRNAPGEQLGLGFRYQLPLSNAMIFRADGMYGLLDGESDVRGLRFELRQKW
ncbi:MAG: hypothetical protein AAFN77_10125 [Planctomycetota bacterium]